MNKDRSLHLLIMAVDVFLLVLTTLAMHMALMRISPNITAATSLRYVLLCNITSYILTMAFFPPIAQKRIVKAEEIIKRCIATGVLFFVLVNLIQNLWVSQHIPVGAIAVFSLIYMTILCVERLAIRKFIKKLRSNKKNMRCIVFAGNTGPYREDSLRDGLTFYDRTKALGELEDHDGCLTLRNSIVGPDINPNGIGLFNWFMKQSTSVKGFTRAIWTGVTTLTLAKAMDAAIQQNLCGLYNLVNNQAISKFDLLKLFNKYCKPAPIDIIPSDDLILDKTLICTRTDFNFDIPSYEQMIIEMKEWIYNHKRIYPEYYYL